MQYLAYCRNMVEVTVIKYFNELTLVDDLMVNYLVTC
jgi:hypothetical protein